MKASSEQFAHREKAVRHSESKLNFISAIHILNLILREFNNSQTNLNLLGGNI